MVERATVVKARRLRRAMTLPEIALGDVLRCRPNEIKFRRQHPIGSFVLALLSFRRLGIEVDWMVHEMGDNPAGGAIGGWRGGEWRCCGSRRGGAVCCPALRE